MTFHQLLPVTLLINLINQYIVMYYYERIIIREELFDVSLEIFMLPSRYIVLKGLVCIMSTLLLMHLYFYLNA